jgi:chromosomal replication initiation ATPase DnaA
MQRKMKCSRFVNLNELERINLSELERILSEVSLYSRTPVKVLKSKSRFLEVVALRALAIKVMLKRGHNLTSIGDFFGHADHTSAMHARDTHYPYDVAMPLILERL